MLEDCSLFSCLNEKEFQSLKEIVIERTIPKKMLVINEGDTTTSLYILLNGKAQAFLMDETGKKIILNMFNKGQYFGEMSFIDSAPRCAAVETIETCRVAILPREGFITLIHANPNLCLNLMKGLLQKLRNATDQIESLVFKDVYQRMARFLTLNAATHDDERVVDGIYTQQQIADILGSSREMVSRVYKELIDGHYIAVKGKRIVIKKDLPYSW